QAIGDWLAGKCILVCPAAAPSKRRGIHHSGGENMRFLSAECIESVGLPLDHNRIRLRIGSVPPVRVETGRDRTLRGQVVVTPCQSEIFIYGPRGMGVTVGGTGGQAVLKQLGAMWRRTVPHTRLDDCH